MGTPLYKVIWSITHALRCGGKFDGIPEIPEDELDYEDFGYGDTMVLLLNVIEVEIIIIENVFYGANVMLENNIILNVLKRINKIIYAINLSNGQCIECEDTDINEYSYMSVGNDLSLRLPLIYMNYKHSNIVVKKYLETLLQRTMQKKELLESQMEPIIISTSGVNNSPIQRLTNVNSVSDEFGKLLATNLTGPPFTEILFQVTYLLSLMIIHQPVKGVYWLNDGSIITKGKIINGKYLAIDATTMLWKNVVIGRQLGEDDVYTFLTKDPNILLCHHRGKLQTHMEETALKEQQIDISYESEVKKENSLLIILKSMAFIN